MKLSRRQFAASAAAATTAACADLKDARAPAAATDAIAGLDGVGIAARIRAGEISAAEAVEAAIARAERVNPHLNFIATPCYDLARARAQTALAGPFAGVPTLIKDLNPLAGVRMMNGSRAFRDHVPDANGVYTDALLASGLVPFAKSCTPEFGLTATTEPMVTGQTKNPWDVTRHSGGSSGGAAAAVAAGVVPVAHANDGGGSVRIPASICGLVGLKLSRGRFVETPPEQPVSIAVEGCVSRSVRDTAAWLAVTERRGAGAVYPEVGMVTGPAARRLRIGLAIPDATGHEPDPAVRAATEAAAAACSGLGHHVDAIAIPIEGRKFIDAFILYWAGGASQIVDQVKQMAPNTPIEDLLEPLTLQLAHHARSAPAGAAEAAVATLLATDAAYASMFETVDVVLTPTLSKPPLKLGEIAPTLPFDVGFGRVLDYVRYTPLVNASGGAAISLPLGWTPDTNLPIGAHFMAAKGQEAMLLALAYELEAAHPWAQRTPPVWAG
jgi:amidase